MTAFHFTGDHKYWGLHLNSYTSAYETEYTIDDSWVKPGVAINDWTSGHTVKSAGFKGAMDTRTMKHYIDFCADYGLEYMSIDAGWSGCEILSCAR